MNKKGASFSSWTEGILLTLAFVIFGGLIYASLNSQYNQNNDGTFGLTDNETMQNFNNLQNQIAASVDEGNAQTDTATGLSLTSAPKIVGNVINIIWGFVSGKWIDRTVGLMDLGVASPTVILVLKILFFMSMAFFLITILFKVVA